ncbi:MAG TPA: ABC transporter ATP-binding protein [Candidatus Acidoferrum sp.]|nr:ABC transporter ATP-binding protein [Candidatus Acidoferrum sp.]
MNFPIETEYLTKNYGRVKALDDLTFSVAEGGVHALVGPNGAGKTTLIKILVNIFHATKGHATVLGVDSTSISGKAFASIGYVSENQQLPLWMRVGDFLKYLRLFYPTWDRKLEFALVDQLDLPVERKLKHLSRGMRTKAALASALAFRPKLIILDEPFSGLDPVVREELGQALVLAREYATTLVSSHDLAEIESFATHLTYLDAGRLRLSEDVPSIRARFREVELTLDAPAAVPENLPSNWLHASASGNILKFIDSAFQQEALQSEIFHRFGTIEHAAFNPMTIRDIFLAVAKSTRKPVKPAPLP